MNQDTINVVTLAIASVSAVASAVATLAACKSVKISRDSLHLQREQQEADKPKLHIRVAPVWSGHRLRAQIMITNKSRRPAHIQTWWIGDKNKGISSSEVLPPIPTPYGGAIPKIIGEHERLDIMMEFRDYNWRDLEQIGVMDEASQPWFAEPDEVKRFLATAGEFAPK